MVKRKSELMPEEICSNFKKNKFDNANGIVELLIKLEAATSKQLVGCIASLTDIALSILKNGDTIEPQLGKPDDLKNAAEKYKDWIQQRFYDIVKKFIKLLLHPKGAVAQRAISSLLCIIQQQSRTEEVFPLVIYTKIIKTLLSSRVDCRKLIRSLKEPLQHHDLAYYSLKVVSKLVSRRSDHAAVMFKTNLVSLVVLITVPPRENPRNVDPPSLWCSSRRVRNKKHSKIVEKPKKKVSEKKQRKEKKKAKLIERSKGKYKDAILEQTKEDDSGEDDEEPAENGEGAGLNDSKEFSDNETEDGNDSEEERKDLNGSAYEHDDKESPELDSDEEQRKKDDEEFKAAQKVKKPRKSRGGIEDLPEQYEEEDVLGPQHLMERMPMPKFKPVADKDRMLPLGAFSIKSLVEVNQEQPDDEEADLKDDAATETENINEGPRYIYDYKLACKYLTMIWDGVMSYTLTEDMYKRCLVFIPERVMQHLNNPVKLTDFFISSYNCGGGVSLLAMHGVFLLMNKHNLQYPDFYPKVYSLLEPSVFHARYKPRFFVLLDIFLSSTYLPEYIAAAFIKRLARLGLFAPANCTLLVVKTIRNLLARFPSLQVLYNDREESEVSCDPYDVVKTDLMASGATKSSLWELATLNKSAPEQIYKATVFIKNIAQLEETDVSSHLETEYDELDPSVEEYADNIKKTSCNFKAVEKLFNDPDGNFHLLYADVC